MKGKKLWLTLVAAALAAVEVTVRAGLLPPAVLPVSVVVGQVLDALQEPVTFAL